MQSDPTQWSSLPGSFDSLHTDYLFPSDHPDGIPELAPTPMRGNIPAHLAPYRTRIRSMQPVADGEVGIHFFLDDYRFESVWNFPNRAVQGLLQTYRIVLTPDFSLYTNWPLAVQRYNVYRKNWCGAYWQMHGLTVIPTIRWGTEDSYDFCFAGVPQNNLVAVGTVGVNFDDLTELSVFLSGYLEMVKRLRPSMVLCYGKLPPQVKKLAPVTHYPTYWDGIDTARKQKARQQHHFAPQEG